MGLGVLDVQREGCVGEGKEDVLAWGQADGLDEVFGLVEPLVYAVLLGLWGLWGLALGGVVG